jgi:hypothetical protein
VKWPSDLQFFADRSKYSEDQEYAARVDAHRDLVDTYLHLIWAIDYALDTGLLGLRKRIRTVLNKHGAHRIRDFHG